MQEIAQDTQEQDIIVAEIVDEDGNVVETRIINRDYIEKVVMKTTDEKLKFLKVRILFILNKNEKLTYQKLRHLIQHTNQGHDSKNEWVDYSDYQIRHQLDKLKEQNLVETKSGAIDAMLIDARRCFYGLSPIGKMVYKYICYLNKLEEKQKQMTLDGKIMDSTTQNVKEEKQKLKRGNYQTKELSDYAESS